VNRQEVAIEDVLGNVNVLQTVNKRGLKEPEIYLNNGVHSSRKLPM
jgi:hypothetical protein